MTAIIAVIAKIAIITIIASPLFVRTPRKVCYIQRNGTIKAFEEHVQAAVSSHFAAESCLYNLSWSGVSAVCSLFSW